MPEDFESACNALCAEIDNLSEKGYLIPIINSRFNSGIYDIAHEFNISPLQVANSLGVDYYMQDDLFKII